MPCPAMSLISPQQGWQKRWRLCNPLGWLMLLIGTTTTVKVQAVDWSTLFAHKASSSDGSNEEATASKEWVSPVTNREIKTSVLAHGWPTTPQNVFCEAYVLLQQQGQHVPYLNALTQLLLDKKKDETITTYADATSLALEAVATSAQATTRPLSSSAVRLFEYMLVMRVASPHCELYRGLARQQLLKRGPSPSLNDDDAVQASNDVLTFLYPGGKQVFLSGGNLHEQPLNVSIDENVLLPGEAVLGGSDAAQSQQKQPIVIMYANLGTKDFATAYQGLKKSGMRFVVRHLGEAHYEETASTSSARSTVLQGYGVRLDIRNVEYKVFYDRSDGLLEAGDDHGGLLNVTDDSLQVNPSLMLAGVNVSAILGQDNDDDESKRHAAQKLQADLWKIHDSQLLHSQIVPPVWQRRQLPLQAATVISESSDPLHTLQTLSQNLPSVASTLVHVKVPETIQAAAAAIEQQRQFKSGMLYFNGNVAADMNRPTFNIFELLNQLREEQNTLQQMHAELGLALNPNILRDVQKAWMMGSEFVKAQGFDNDHDDGSGLVGDNNAFRIDVGRGWKQAIIYLNDIEKDSQYEHWSRSLRQMLMNMQFGMPPTVRRNLFTVVAVLDPIKYKSDNVGLVLSKQLMQSSYPARLGVLVVGEEDVESCAEWLSSEQSTPTVDDDALDCPVNPIFAKDPKSVTDLKDIPATSQAVHRLVAHFSQHYASSQPGALVAYFEYLISSMQESSGLALSMYDLASIHGNLIEGMQMASQPEGLEKAFQILKTEEGRSGSAQYIYGRALRFVVDKRLKPRMGFLNGIPLPMDTQDESVSKIMGEEQSYIFGLIMKGDITDTSPKSIYAKLLSGDRVYKTYHPLLSQTSDEGTTTHKQFKHDFSGYSLLFSGPTFPMSADAYFVVDAYLEYDQLRGLQLASELLSTLSSFQSTIESPTSGTKHIGLVYRILPSTKSASESVICSVLAHAALLGAAAVQKVIREISFPLNDHGLETILSGIGDLSSDVREKIMSKKEEGGPCTSSYLHEQLLFPKNTLVANGRVYDIEGKSVDANDIELLLSLELPRAIAVTNLLRNHFSFSQPSDVAVVANIASYLATRDETSRVNINESIDRLAKRLTSNTHSLLYSWNTDVIDDIEPLQVQVTAIIDPVSEAAQRLSPFLSVIRDQLKLPLQVLLTPAPILEADTKVPITSYYRFVADPTALADAAPPQAVFSNLPTNHLLTLQVDVPEPWNVQQSAAVQDTDNLRCDIRSGCGDDTHSDNKNTIPVYERNHLTNVEYDLKNLLIFGQCYESTGSPPNGLQLTLTRSSDGTTKHISSGKVEIGMDGSISSETSSSSDDHAVSIYSDTLVMRNVGYWQLPANPGVWQLSMAEESKGAEIFEMIDGSVRNGKIVMNKDGNARTRKTVVLKDFVSNSELLLVRRRHGFDDASLFHDEQVNPLKNSDDEVINVFSVATGHLYERLLKIMMLSVTKRTSLKVKFWLFENYLSPTFKSSARAMADRIGCEVEFVTYKWPEWLRGQSEKQRIIWGYKILFLDVLFPLSVKKFIVVDADQVIRADLKELWDLDLKGHAYGYTPFCTSRETTLGFQFWREGFWKNHLRDKPYHISALYVVDLDRFRRTLVGDVLRSIYQQLSADPNSLANLDQDLPNYAQHQVPIFSLPQEWLWCESWCSDETKAAAKTIDLCNNPLHKEHKVSMAKRIISGPLFNESWVELDAEVERYEQEYFSSQRP